jgi:hypothetical protein
MLIPRFFRDSAFFLKHDEDDEFFFVLDGVFFVDLEDRVIELKPWQGSGRGAELPGAALADCSSQPGRGQLSIGHLLH